MKKSESVIRIIEFLAFLDLEKLDLILQGGTTVIFFVFLHFLLRVFGAVSGLFRNTKTSERAYKLIYCQV